MIKVFVFSIFIIAMQNGLFAQEDSLTLLRQGEVVDLYMVHQSKLKCNKENTFIIKWKEDGYDTKYVKVYCSGCMVSGSDMSNKYTMLFNCNKQKTIVLGVSTTDGNPIDRFQFEINPPKDTNN